MQTSPPLIVAPARRRAAAVVLAGSALAFTGIGCVNHPTIRKTPGTHPTTMQVTLNVKGAANQPGENAPPPLIHVDIYEFDVPMDAISANSVFWSHVDESRIGSGSNATHQLALNGLRAGVGRKADWPYFRATLLRSPDRTRKASITNNQVEAMRLNVDKTLETEDLFVYDASDHLQGRSYEACTNTMTLSFASVPAQPGVVRLAVCPVVIMVRHQLKYTAVNNEYVSPFEDVKQYFNLDLHTEVQSDEFLVISPGKNASRSTSVGARFLLTNQGSEQLEQVLVIIPTPMRLDGRPFDFNDTSVHR